ncbi:MAG: hypothetical protein ACYSUF_08000 [Planctomycetota bacterium]|jgi:hypothetical protein
MSERRFNLRKTALRVGIVGAWVFALATLATLVSIAWARWPGTDSTSHIMGVTVDGELYAGLGFRYEGIPGTVLILAEALYLTAGIVMSILPRNRPRRVGHVMLVAWAGLWLGNAVNIARLDGRFIWVVWIGLLGLLLVCTLLRAARGWSTGGSPRQAAKADVAS